MSDQVSETQSPRPTSPLDELLVNLLLALRAQHLKANPSNRMTHWDKLQNAVQMSARTTSDPSEWLSVMRDQMRIGAPWRETAQLECQLIAMVPAGSAFLEMIERRYVYLIALTRVEAEARQKAAEIAAAAKLAAKHAEPAKSGKAKN